MKYWSTLCCSLFCFWAFGQVEQHFDINLEWKTDDGVNYWLEGGQRSAEFPGAWTYSISFPLPSNSPIQAELNVMVEEEWNSSNIRGLAQAYDVQAWPSSDRGEFSGIVTIVANREDNGQILRLKEADLKVVYEIRSGSPSIPDPVRESALASGDVYKLGIDKSGMYKITGSELSSRLNVSLSSIDPNKLQLLGNPGGPLPWSISTPRNDDLVPIAYRWYGLDDGRLDGQDYMIFYAEGADDWKTKADRWERNVNTYDDLNYVYIKLGSENYAPVTTITSEDDGVLKDTYMDRQYYGKAALNLLGKSIEHQGSGIMWVSDELSNTRTIDLSDEFDFNDLDISSPLYVNAHVYGRAESSSTFFLNIGNQEFDKRVSSTSLEIESQFASRGVFSELVDVNSESFDIRLDYPEISKESWGWLDYITILSRKNALASSLPKIITDTFSTDRGGFEISGFTSGMEVWDITDYNEAVEVRPVIQNNRAQLRVLNPNHKEFVVFDPNSNDLLAPVSYESIANQNLHALDDLDMVTIYHPLFRAEAERHAQHRVNHDNFNVATVDVNDIYNEFASGRREPTAIRDFLRMLYVRNPRFRYCLLFGDGSYDYRHQDKTHEDQNFVPVFETENSLHPIFAYPTDDFYALLDEGEGGNLSGSLDIAVGRYICRTEDEARLLVDKQVHYDTSTVTFGDWRNRLVYLADDEDSNQHAIDIERLSKQSATEHFEYNQDKIYFDAYTQVSTPAGTRFPEATEAIQAATFRGALSLTYLGHGGPTGLAQERVVQVKDILSWDNMDRLPVVITATCSFTAYDEPTITSAGEHSVLSPRGGSIAALSTVRAVYANENYQLTRAAQQFLYDENNGQQYRLGEVMRLAKNSIQGGSQDSNNRKFSLFGDPSMKLALPRYHVGTTKINDQDATTFEDTLGALDRVQLEGAVLDDAGEILTDFNGTINITVFDKPITLSTKGTDLRSRPMEFDLQKNVLFKGASSVKNGEWAIDFVLPKDLNFTVGQGKISYYAHDGVSRDANGYFNQILIGGSGNQEVQDDQGPTVEVFMNDENFQFGGITSPDPILFVKLSDDYGINVVGNSIGHDLTGVLDYNTQNTFILNDFYEADQDDSRKGVVRYPLFDLEDGRHHISVTAWDIANNFSEGFTEFVVVSDASESIQKVLSYPNPFSDFTTFGFEHNFPPGRAEIDVIIVNAAGQEVNRIEEEFDVAGFRVTEVKWDGTDYAGNKVPNGVYLYKIIMRRNVFGRNNTKESSFERVVVLK